MRSTRTNLVYSLFVLFSIIAICERFGIFRIGFLGKVVAFRMQFFEGVIFAFGFSGWDVGISCSHISELCLNVYYVQVHSDTLLRTSSVHLLKHNGT